PGGRSRHGAPDRERFRCGARLPLGEHDDARGGLRIPRFEEDRRLRPGREAPAAPHARGRRRRLLEGRDLTMALLSAESLARIDREITKYPPEQKQSAVMSALAIAQDQHGWLSNELMEEVANYLGMRPGWGYEV